MTSQALFDQALSLHQAGQLAQAEPRYVQWLMAQPEHFQAQYLLGMLRYEQGRDAEALPPIEAALKRNPEFVEALMLHGALMIEAGRPDAALADFARATQLRPDLTQAWHEQGVALQSLKRPEEALASYDRALALHPGYAPSWNNRGGVLQDLKRPAEAVASHDRALAIRADDPDAWSNRGAALRALLRYDEAIASYDRALTLDPHHFDARYMRARALQIAQRFDEAIADFEAALALRPDYLPTLTAYAATLCEARRIDEGLKIYARYAQLAYGAAPVGAAGDPEHKIRHDAEQRAYLADLDPADLPDGARLAGPAVNPKNAAKIEAEWRESSPQIVVIDDLLTGEALEKLRQFCWGSAIWRRAYPDGYLGAMPEHGFTCPLLAQIAEEFSATYPAIFGAHGLTMLWSFKYDARLNGIRIHADRAAVNVNFWITPDVANRDPGHGGLVIWDATAPLDWEITKYNGDEPAARAFLAQAGAKSATVPYRANRAVIFDSDLFHETDRIDFEEGYLNRRINITLLYGRRRLDES